MTENWAIFLASFSIVFCNFLPFPYVLTKFWARIWDFSQILHRLYIVVWIFFSFSVFCSQGNAKIIKWWKTSVSLIRLIYIITWKRSGRRPMWASWSALESYPACGSECDPACDATQRSVCTYTIVQRGRDDAHERALFGVRDVAHKCSSSWSPRQCPREPNLQQSRGWHRDNPSDSGYRGSYTNLHEKLEQWLEYRITLRIALLMRLSVLGYLDFNQAADFRKHLNKSI